MGNYRFRLSDMIPNAWFYKLKDMGRLKNHTTTRKKHKTSPKSNQPHFLPHQRKSYYFTRDLIDLPPPTPPNSSFETTLYNYNSPTKKTPRFSDTHFPDPPRKSTKKKPNSKKVKNHPSAKIVTSSSVTAGCSCRTSVESLWTKPESTMSEAQSLSPLDCSSDFESVIPEMGSDSIDGLVSLSSSCDCRVNNDLGNKPFIGKFDGFGFNSISELELPPIITKKRPTKFTEAIEDLKKKQSKDSIKFEGKISHGSSKEFQKTSPVRRISSVSYQGVRIRTNSPKIARRKIQSIGRKSVSSSGRRSLSETFAVVKSSSDPQKDFRESMVEMILENNIKASKDLEDLLACYLSLNSYEYHDLIIKVFKTIWLELK